MNTPLLPENPSFHFRDRPEVYLYKCPFCVFGGMDSTKGCGSDDFISTAFLPVSPSISRLTEAMSLKMSHGRPHKEFWEKKGDAEAGCWSIARNWWNKAPSNKRGSNSNALKEAGRGKEVEIEGGREREREIERKKERETSPFRLAESSVSSLDWRLWMCCHFVSGSWWYL